MPTFGVKYDREQVEQTVRHLEQAFPEKIEHIRFSIGEDWASEPALFFRVLLKDPENRFDDLASRDAGTQRDFTGLCRMVITAITESLRFEVHQPYFDFRTVPQQEKLRSPEWE